MAKHLLRLLALFIALKLLWMEFQPVVEKLLSQR